MRIKTIPITLALFAAVATVAAPATVRAQSNPCGEKLCNLVFDWGGSQPDVDRRYGAPSEMENAITAGLTAAGWRFASAGQASTMTLTFRLTPQKKALCDTMPGVSPDYSCHTVSRAAVVFTPNDSTQKALARVDVNPRCSDPKQYPTFPQFGRYAAETVIYTVMLDGKGQRPSVKCQ